MMNQRSNITLMWLIALLLIVANMIGADAFVCQAGAQDKDNDSVQQDEKHLRFVPHDDTSGVFNFRDLQTGLPLNCPTEQIFSELSIKEASEYHIAHFIYGQSNSRSVTVALLKSEAGKTNGTLHVDLNRDKVFQPTEKFVTSNIDQWHIPLDAEFVVSTSKYTGQSRSVWLRFSEGNFQVATAGTMRGNVKLGGQILSVERIDRDSNGTWTDESDRIVIDRDANGKLDSITERFACDHIVHIDDTRFRMGSDPEGNWVKLLPLSGNGKIIASLKTEEACQFKDLNLILASRSGIHVTISSLDQAVELPVGEYSIEKVSFTVEDDQNSLYFAFSAYGKPKMIEVSVGETCSLDVLGAVKLQGRIDTVSNRSNSLVNVTPNLVTDSGLYLTKSLDLNLGTEVYNYLSADVLVSNQLEAQQQSGFT